MKRMFFFVALILCSAQVLFGQETTASLAAAEPPAASPSKAAMSKTEMAERLILMEQTMQAYQEEVERLQAEVKSLKAGLQAAAPAAAGKDRGGAGTMALALPPSNRATEPPPAAPQAPTINKTHGNDSRIHLAWSGESNSLSNFIVRPLLNRRISGSLFNLRLECLGEDPTSSVRRQTAISVRRYGMQVEITGEEFASALHPCFVCWVAAMPFKGPASICGKCH